MPRRRYRFSTLPPSHTNALERRLCFLNISCSVLLCGAHCFYRIFEACSVMHKHLPEISFYQSKHPYFNIRLTEIRTICRKSTSVMGRFVRSTLRTTNLVTENKIIPETNNNSSKQQSSDRFIRIKSYFWREILQVFHTRSLIKVKPKIARLNLSTFSAAFGNLHFSPKLINIYYN